ncbi:class I SAM-dependent methyltransferase [Dactylosporangium aurantiacum]|uniref:Class I SAM-dependent methyltransferase n=1 Tax=Dactylosporangium aurantiacum TaxID=35754 RepID=A0A9Q9MCA0_9ACTN|nr:class I SAM-dependent methyltransferase [Dactylosporangium aurantiacum]MDG6106946.1 class I SAM-dependent methyltransferase [Dactylosporangium aurantiacum]UWZ50694.1 class I SAM-dependent methyltransferase [Dactylosporangium aurantiacum]
MNTNTTPAWDESDTAAFLRYADVFVPRRAEQFRIVCALLRDLPHPSVLELGCGDGALTETIIRQRPDIAVTAVDAAGTMLAAARRRLADVPAHVRFVHADLRDQHWRTGRYGAVVTSLAVHHLDDDAKRHLFGSVLEMLRPGGIYVQCDLIEPAAEVTRRVAAEQWDHLVEEQAATAPAGREAADAFHDSQWNTFRYPDPVDQPAPVSAQLGWLAAAGFEGVDVCWAAAGHAVLAATRGTAG